MSEPLQWFPGHMKKAREVIEASLPLVDVVVELRDARIPKASENPLLRRIIGRKPCMVALNKIDLADSQVTKAWLKYLRAAGFAAVAIDAAGGRGLKELTALAKSLAKPAAEKLVEKGVRPRAARIMIVGITNVGKSTLINRLTAGGKAKVANKPGVTRDKQWIRLEKSLELLDTPGVLWPKFEDETIGLHLAFTGAINDAIYDRESVAALLLAELAAAYPRELCGRFKLDALSEIPPGELLLAVARSRGLVRKGGVADLEKAASLVLTEFRSGKLGGISLELPPYAEEGAAL